MWQTGVGFVGRLPPRERRALHEVWTDTQWLVTHDLRGQTALQIRMEIWGREDLILLVLVSYSLAFF